MDLTKEALEFLAEQSIEPKERQLKIGGQDYIINKDGEPVDEDELDIAERVASDLGGTIRKIYVSDKE